MENILERAIIPRNPSPTALLNKEKYTLYAPVARSGQPGIAQFDDVHFVITDQIVQINTNIIATVSHVAMVHNGLVERIDTKIRQEQIRSDAYAEAYADEKVQQEQVRSDQYAEAKRDEAKAYADGQAAQALADAKSYTDTLVSAGWTREIVTELPSPENAKSNVVYMLRRNTGLNTQDIYDEYFLVNINGVLSLELLGNTELDLSQYAPLVDGKVPVANIPTAAFDILRGYFNMGGTDFHPVGEHNEELNENGYVTPRRGVLYVDIDPPNDEAPFMGAVCIWRGNGFERIATVGDLQSMKQSIDWKIEDVEQDVDALDGRVSSLTEQINGVEEELQMINEGGVE